jgi:hypothetical protein
MAVSHLAERLNAFNPADDAGRWAECSGGGKAIISESCGQDGECLSDHGNLRYDQ